jgi:hypothetical protein
VQYALRICVLVDREMGRYCHLQVSRR